MKAIEGLYEVVGEPKVPAYRVPWGTLIWLTLCILAAAIACAQEQEPVGRAAITVGAALLAPMFRLFALVAQKVSEPEARQARQDRLSQRAKRRGYAG
jgi:hypothetical protein